LECFRESENNETQRNLPGQEQNLGGKIITLRYDIIRKKITDTTRLTSHGVFPSFATGNTQRALNTVPNLGDKYNGHHKHHQRNHIDVVYQQKWKETAQMIPRRQLSSRRLIGGFRKSRSGQCWGITARQFLPSIKALLPQPLCGHPHCHGRADDGCGHAGYTRTPAGRASQS